MKSHKKNVLIYHIGFVTLEDLSCSNTNSVKPLHLTINKTKGKIEESNRNKYLTLVTTNESKEILKKYAELRWFTSKNMRKHYNMVIVVRYVFHEGNKYYPNVFLDECLHKL